METAKINDNSNFDIIHQIHEALLYIPIINPNIFAVKSEFVGNGKPIKEDIEDVKLILEVLYEVDKVLNQQIELLNNDKLINQLLNRVIVFDFSELTSHLDTCIKICRKLKLDEYELKMSMNRDFSYKMSFTKEGLLNSLIFLQRHLEVITQKKSDVLNSLDSLDSIHKE